MIDINLGVLKYLKDFPENTAIDYKRSIPIEKNINSLYKKIRHKTFMCLTLRSMI